MITAEGLAAAGQMITRYRGGARCTDDDIARITGALRDLRVRDDARARMDPAHPDAHLRLRIDVVRRAQPGYVAAPAALLTLASSRQPQVMARAVIRTTSPPADRAATRKDAERGRLLQATATAGWQRQSLPVLLQPMRGELARPVRQRQASERTRQTWLGRYRLC